MALELFWRVSEIRNVSFIRKRADFSGLRFGNIRPTDIDGAIEFEGRCCVFMETKHGMVDIPTGQRLFLERVCDKWGVGGIVLIMNKAQGGGTALTYNIASLPVVEFRHAGKWRSVEGRNTCLQWVERFASKTLGRKIVAATLPNEARAVVAAVGG